ncbi:glycosyltransferase [Thermodesulfobacteriota bacterium]
MVPRIAVVIVNWNKKNDVLSLLTELQNVPKPGFDVFVVDNASDDGSVAAIRDKFPNVTLIISKINIGGTGGFNRGIDYVCQKNRYKYIWLLDNDSKIKNDTLSELVSEMESDSQIGLSGSRIVDIDNKEMTVETGGNFRWDIIGSVPVNRNTTENLFYTIDVDYVAICSALVRVEALKQVGLMDDRLFLFWDDMDWGLCFKKHGFKVVTVSKSIVYHGSFTERNRGDVTDYYYGVRNAFLVYTKHTNFTKRALIFYRTLKDWVRTYVFFETHNRKYASKLMVTALKDYFNNRWGKFISNHDDREMNTPGTNFTTINKGYNFKKILAPVSGASFQDIENMLEALKTTYPEAVITILVHNDRIDYYDNYRTSILEREKVKTLRYALNKFIQLRREKFDCVATITPSPFIYTAKHTLFYHKTDDVITLHHTGFMSFAKLCAALCWGEIFAHLLFPILLLKSIQYQNKS